MSWFKCTSCSPRKIQYVTVLSLNQKELITSFYIHHLLNDCRK